MAESTGHHKTMTGAQDFSGHVVQQQALAKLGEDVFQRVLFFSFKLSRGPVRPGLGTASWAAMRGVEHTADRDQVNISGIFTG